MLESFEISLEKMTPLRPMADSYGVGDSKAEWPNNILSNLTEVYEDGKIGKYPTPVIHKVCPTELELCQTLSQQAAQIAQGAPLFSETDCAWEPFFVTSNIGDPHPGQITAHFTEELFAKNIFPKTPIWVESLAEQGEWYQEVFEEEEDEANQEYIQAWRNLVEWFCSEPEILNPVFVRIGDDRVMWEIPESDYPPGTEMTGSCFPRLIVGLTKQASVVGLVGHAVLT